MPSLMSLVAAHASVLLVDSASNRIHVGLLRAQDQARWWSAPSDAGVGIFSGVEALLVPAGLNPSEAGAFVFCEGPGSILGIRTAAMALRTWQAVADHPAKTFGYISLELVALDLCRAAVSGPFAVVTDARRGAWHFVVTGPRRMTAGELGLYEGNLFAPEGFGAWSTPPRPVQPVSYDPPALWGRHGAAELLRSVSEPGALQYDAASYALWTPRIHRAGPAQNS
jgi:tRNA threonylcarbamoyladenosine biosynthesis protein TsaB